MDLGVETIWKMPSNKSNGTQSWIGGFGVLQVFSGQQKFRMWDTTQRSQESWATWLESRGRSKASRKLSGLWRSRMAVVRQQGPRRLSRRGCPWNKWNPREGSVSFGVWEVRKEQHWTICFDTSTNTVIWHLVLKLFIKLPMLRIYKQDPHVLCCTIDMWGEESSNPSM